MEFREIIEPYIIPYFYYKLPRSKKLPKYILSDTNLLRLFELKKNGIRQKEIAEELRLDSGYVSGILNGKRLKGRINELLRHT